MKQTVIYPDWASVPTLVVSNAWRSSFTFLCLTPEYVYHFEETFAVSAHL